MSWMVFSPKFPEASQTVKPRIVAGGEPRCRPQVHRTSSSSMVLRMSVRSSVGLIDGVAIDEVAAGIGGAGFVVTREATVSLNFTMVGCRKVPFEQQAMSVSVHVIGGDTYRKVFVHGHSTFD